MAELDPSIVLNTGNINDPQKMLSLRALAQAVEQKQQQARQQNMLKQLLAKPGAINPSTGIPTADTIGAIAQTGDVDTASDLANKASEIEKRDHETQLKKLELGKSEAFEPAMLAYEDAVARGVPEPEARQVGESQLNAGLDNLAKSGQFSADDVAKFQRKFDPVAMRANLMKYADVVKERQADRRLDEQERAAQAREAAADRRSEQADKRLELMLTGGPDIDPANPAIKKAANYEIDPQSLLSRGTPQQRLKVLDALVAANPDFDQVNYGARFKAVKDFSTGKQGDIARSLNVSVAHLETLRDLGKALDNGDVNLVNAAKQRWSEEFGSPAPTNFDTAKAIVADEVAKGVIGGQTAQSDRETLAESLLKSRSPAQIEGAINTFQSLLGGQLGGLRSQYERTTGAKNFNDKFLSPATRKALEGREAAPKAPQSTAPQVVGDKKAYDALPDGAPYTVPGDKTVYHKGKR